MIRIIVTGGTFDKEYDELKGSLCFKHTHLDEVLKMGRNQTPVVIEELMMIDSLAMTDADRAVIAAACHSSKEDKIVITHGTDTMTVTASFLADLNLQKTIVLTGAMIPFAFVSSDGLFNAGAAIAFAQSLPHGCYVAMNGQFFKAGQVRKDKARGEFVAERSEY